MTNQEKRNRETPDTAVPGELGWRLGMVLRGYQERLETAVTGMPEGIRGFQILSTVVHRDPPNQVALGAHLGIDRTVLTYLLDTLVDAGLVERIPSPADRRARKINTTDKGRAMLTHYEEKVATLESELLSSLSESEAITFSTLIGGLAMAVHRAEPGTNPCEAMDHLP